MLNPKIATSRFSSILSANQFTDIGNKIRFETSIFANVWFQIKQVWAIFAHLKTQPKVGKNLNY